VEVHGECVEASYELEKVSHVIESGVNIEDLLVLSLPVS